MGRSVVAVLLGFAVAAIVIMTINLISGQIYRAPAGMDMTHPDARGAYVQQLPLTALLIVVVGWAIGSVAGGWMAAKRAPGAPMLHAGIVGLGLVAASLMNLAALPHPTWMWVAGPLSHVAGVVAGARLAMGGPEAQAA